MLKSFANLTCLITLSCVTLAACGDFDKDAFAPIHETEDAAENALTAKLEPIPPRENSYYNIINKETGKCLAVRNGNINAGASMVLSKCAKLDSQRFRMRDYDDTYFDLLGDMSRKCLQIRKNSTQPGAAVVQMMCSNSDPQLLSFVPSNDAWMQIKFKNSGLCLDIEMGKPGAQPSAVQKTCGAANSQQWRVVGLIYGQRWPVEQLP